MSGHSTEEIRKETRGYVLVFVALAALTLVTVGVSYLHLSFGAAVALALFIASIKGSLVAAYFFTVAIHNRAGRWRLSGLIC